MTIDTAFTHFPMLTTDRLNLRQRQPGDAEAMFAIKSNPQVTHVYAQEPHQSLEDTDAWIQRLQGYYDRREAFSGV